MEQISAEVVDVLVVEDNQETASSITSLLDQHGYHCGYCRNLGDAMAMVLNHCPRLMLLGLTLPDGNALDSLAEFKKLGVQEIIVIGDTGRSHDASACLKVGAYDFISKPLKTDELLASLRRVSTLLKLEQLQPGTYPFKLHPGFGSLEGKSKASRRMFGEIRVIAKSLSPGSCLITGPAGSLKNDVAASVHANSLCQGPAYLINCAGEDDEKAIPRFTGISDGENLKVPGYLHMATAGILVLDDLSALRMELQILLSDYLHDLTYTPLNALTPEAGTCSIIGILREDPQQAIDQGRLDSRLFARLSAKTVEVPSLLQRIDDIDIFAHHAVRQLNTVFGTEKGISAEFMRELKQYAWPGGLVECRNLILMGYRLTEPGEDISSQGVLFTQDKPALSCGITPFIGSSLQDAERQLIEATLAAYDNNKRRVADVLGVSVKTLYNRLKSYETIK